MVRLGAINMVLHGIEEPKIAYQDTLSAAFDQPRVDVVLANPPFSGSVDREGVDLGLGDTARTELLFLERCRRMLLPGGRAGIVVPEGVLFGSSRAHREARRRLLLEATVEAVVLLPTGLFHPYSNVRTAVVLIGEGRATERVWFCPAGTEEGRGAELGDVPGAVHARLRGTQPAAAGRDGPGAYVHAAYCRWLIETPAAFDALVAELVSEP